MYPASEKYTREYCYLWHVNTFRWTPKVFGFFNQNGSPGLILCVSATEKDFYNPSNHENLTTLLQRLERVRVQSGAEHKTFAGILPSLMTSKKVMEESVERMITVRAVLRALEEVTHMENLPADVQVIVLGGAGFVGRELMTVADSKRFSSVDLNQMEMFKKLTERLRGQPTILLNLTKRGALRAYAPHLWPEVVVVNEVYPEPSKAEVLAIQAAGASIYHIAGVKARAWPPFPRAYAGGIPCCASFWPDEEREGKYEVVIKKM
jgi:hypothetical protein